MQCYLPAIPVLLEIEIIEVNDQFLITGYRNLIDTDCVSWIVARKSGTFQRVVNDRTAIWPKKVNI